MSVEDIQNLATLEARERHYSDYLSRRDPIASDRMLWRAQAFRHTVHLLPGQRILELGCGTGIFTRALLKVTRGENPITSVTFIRDGEMNLSKGGGVELLNADALPGGLAGRKFDFVVGMDLLDCENASWLLVIVRDLLAPGGQLVFYESNPWNPVHQLKNLVSRLIGRRDPRLLMSKTSLYELLSEIGFIRIYAVFNDFVFPPLTRRLIWWFRNLSILLENAPVVRKMAGSILLHGKKPPLDSGPRPQPLFAHESLRRAVSVVVPCHNEEMNVVPLIERLLGYYGEYIHEVIPVNDNSRDSTGQVLDQLAAADPRIRPIHRKPPNGVGRAISEGLRAATGRYVLTMDCDFQHLLPEFRDLFDAAAEGNDVVIGSRFSRHSVLLNYPFMKIVANRVFHALARVLLWENFRDLTNNLKLFRREVVETLQLRQPGFAINAETGLQPVLAGYRVKEVPISWINRTPGMGTSSFRLVRVGGGYWQVLRHAWMRKVLGVGPYKPFERSQCPESDLQDDLILP